MNKKQRQKEQCKGGLKTTGLDRTEQSEKERKEKELSRPRLKRWNTQIPLPPPAVAASAAS